MLNINNNKIGAQQQGTAGLQQLPVIITTTMMMMGSRAILCRC